MAEPMEASTSGCRADGRGLEEFRTVFIKTRVLSQAKGSAYVEFGTTKVMVGVFGPRQSEVKLGFTDTGRLNCEVRLTSFASHKLAKSGQTQLESSAAQGLQQALEPSVQLDKFPKAVFDVSAMILEAGGSDLAVLITAASVALADAGVELYDLVPAVQVSKQRGLLLLDPSLEESGAEEGGMLVGLMPELNEVTALNVRGLWADSEMQEGLELALGGCGQLKAAMREALLTAAVEGGL
ncbi:hypothetical protein VOLCADRAFT_89262 [Volvox carteri f. nagariensis]|uniref:Exoribonuclease phosphorolytic domain-containing protein n=1 Tax=Volvox carteri f. nagariensis TaxID=3068 RepID=D8TR89_VOLCA|nr:uncharacterized protein VOLCADRAFT_89262 [Volvox carteri f. nagariensis]EFJ49848.1 hypothetical protein VOLCADRAFT_89262 [Volvox carteri f. nagariensis]|eukprot:XP_002948913.1 hypothetical protein VOLCADRAFT_89262 [Volvox carteri f. nagariensis]